MRRRKPKSTSKSTPSQISYHEPPSGFTLFRHQHYDISARELFKVLHERMKLRLWLRDREIVQKIQAADTLEALLDLAGQATGLGEDAWSERLSAYGSEALPAIAERLRTFATIRDEGEREILVERLISELRWRGKNGAQTLLASLDGLDAYARGLACVAMGLTGLEEAADVIWEIYQSSLGDNRDRTFIGPLWGLVDLKDERVQHALVDQLAGGRWFYELFGFISLRSMEEALIPLMAAIGMAPEELRVQPFMALVSVAHRLGREQVASALEGIATSEQDREISQGMVEKIFSISPREVEEHFESFYAGMSTDTLGHVLGEID